MGVVTQGVSMMSSSSVAYGCRRTEKEWQLDHDEAWDKLKIMSVVDEGVLSGAMTPLLDPVGSSPCSSVYPEQERPACPFDLELITEEAEKVRSMTPDPDSGCGQAFGTLPGARLSCFEGGTPMLMERGLSGCLVDDNEDTCPVDPIADDLSLQTAPATTPSFDWLTLLHESVPAGPSGPRLKTPTRLCGSKRSQSDNPPPLPPSSRLVSRLGWNFPGQMSPRYLYLKLDKFLRSCSDCKEIDAAAAEYEITGLYQPEGLPNVHGFCRFELNLFETDVGTRVQSKRSGGDSFVYHELVRQIGTMLDQEIGSYNETAVE